MCAIFSGCTTLSEYACVAERAPSLTRTLNAKSPVAVGVPESRPEELSWSPLGSEPSTTDHVCEPPPAAESCTLYEEPSVTTFGVSADWLMLTGATGAGGGAPPLTTIVNSGCGAAGRHQSALGGFWSLRLT